MPTEKQLAAIAKAREANAEKRLARKAGEANPSSGGMGFENPQQLGQQAGELWLKGFNSAIQSGLKETLGSFRNQSAMSSGTRGGTSAQHAKAGRKGGKAKASHSGG